MSRIAKQPRQRLVLDFSVPEGYPAAGFYAASALRLLRAPRSHFKPPEYSYPLIFVKSPI